MSNSLYRQNMKAAIVLVSTFFSVSSLSAAVNYETRYLTGDSAPGSGQTFSYFGLPLINNAGQIAFWAGTSASDRGFWSEGSGSTELVALDGMAAPDTTGVFSNLDHRDNFYINDSGHVMFENHLSIGTGGVTSDNDAAIWSNESGALRLVAREGSVAPGTSGAVFSDTLRANGHGLIAAKLRVGTAGVTADTDTGFWTETAGSLNLIAREGDTAPDTGGGIISRLQNVVRNKSGQFVFLGDLQIGTGGATSGNDDSGLWSNRSGTTELIARAGNTAPGTGGGVFRGFLTGLGFGINDAGQVAFVGDIFAAPGGRDGVGVWSDSSGSFDLISLKDSPAPGTPPGVTFDFQERVSINDGGDVSIFSSLSGTGDPETVGGVWSEQGGVLNLIARDGDPAPGTGTTFKKMFDNAAHTFSTNSAGQVAFRSVSGVSSSKPGIWATDPDGQLTLIAREGDTFDINDDPLIDDFRTIKHIYVAFSGTGGEDGGPRIINDAGQIVFRLSFHNGIGIPDTEGIFVATINISLTGDINGDGFVGLDDINPILANWNQNVTAGDASLGDLTNDGFVGIDDLNIILSEWNNGTPPPINSSTLPANTPEPTTLTLFALFLTLTPRPSPKPMASRPWDRCS